MWGEGARGTVRGRREKQWRVGRDHVFVNSRAGAAVTSYRMVSGFSLSMHDAGWFGLLCSLSFSFELRIGASASSLYALGTHRAAAYRVSTIGLLRFADGSSSDCWVIWSFLFAGSDMHRALARGFGRRAFALSARQAKEARSWQVVLVGAAGLLGRASLPLAWRRHGEKGGEAAELYDGTAGGKIADHLALHIKLVVFRMEGGCQVFILGN